ncbi:hypothetical protein D3C86_990070 [compost metagenome]
MYMTKQENLKIRLQKETGKWYRTTVSTKKQKLFSINLQKMVQSTEIFTELV